MSWSLSGLPFKRRLPLGHDLAVDADEFSGSLRILPITQRPVDEVHRVQCRRDDLTTFDRTYGLFRNSGVKRALVVIRVLSFLRSGVE